MLFFTESSILCTYNMLKRAINCSAQKGAYLRAWPSLWLSSFHRTSCIFYRPFRSDHHQTQCGQPTFHRASQSRRLRQKPWTHHLGKYTLHPINKIKYGTQADITEALNSQVHLDTLTELSNQTFSSVCSAIFNSLTVMSLCSAEFGIFN